MGGFNLMVLVTSALCDICSDSANIQASAEGDANILMNTADGHGNYAWHVTGGIRIDLCQKHKDEMFILFTKLFGTPTPEKER